MKEPRHRKTVCSCATASTRLATPGAGVGPGGAAAGVDPALKAANLRHLRRIEGQVAGLARMIEQDRYCTDVVTQISAVRESLRAVARNLVRNHLKHCASRSLRAHGAAADAMHEELVELLTTLAR